VGHARAESISAYVLSYALTEQGDEALATALVKNDVMTAAFSRMGLASTDAIPVLLAAPARDWQFTRRQLATLSRASEEVAWHGLAVPPRSRAAI
jgi:hypothetical protein